MGPNREVLGGVRLLAELMLDVASLKDLLGKS